MNTTTFDTHLYIKQLREEGITERQTEIFADMVLAILMSGWSEFSITSVLWEKR